MSQESARLRIQHRVAWGIFCMELMNLSKMWGKRGEKPGRRVLQGFKGVEPLFQVAWPKAVPMQCRELRLQVIRMFYANTVSFVVRFEPILHTETDITGQIGPGDSTDCPDSPHQPHARLRSINWRRAGLLSESTPTRDILSIRGYPKNSHRYQDLL